MADGSLIFDTRIDQKGFEDGLNKLKSTGTKALKAVGTVAATAGTAIAAMGAYATKTSIDFESAFAGVRKTVDATEAEFAMLEKGIRDMSKKMPQSASAIAEVAEAAGQLGIKTENILGFTETMVMLGDATNMSSDQAATALARLANITGMSQTDFDRLGSTIVELGNNLATTEGEIVEMGLRLAGTASQVGLTENEILALAGAMSSVGINAEAGGSSMSRVMQKMNTEVLSGGKNLSKFAEIAGMSAEEFSKAWKDKPTEVITAFINGLDDVNASGGDVTTMLKELGINSTQEIDTLLRLSGASDVLTDALGMSAEAWEENVALAEEAEQRYQTTESMIQILKNNIDDLVISVGDGLKDSARDGIGTAIEMVEQLASAFETGGLAGLVEELGTVFADVATNIAEYAPMMLEAGVNMIMSFITGIRENLPAITESALSILQTLITSILEMLPEIISLGAELLISLITGIAEMLPNLTTQIIDTIIMVADTIIQNLPLIIDAGIQLITALVEGIINNLPTLIAEVPRIINEFASAIYSNLPTILKAAIEIMLTIIKGLIESIPTLVANIPQIIMAIVNVITLYNWTQLGKNVIKWLGDGIKSMVGNITGIAKNLANAVTEAIKGIFKSGTSIGSNFITGIINGIKSLLSNIISTASNLANSVIKTIINAFKEAPNIGSNMVKGIWNGIDNVTGWILDKIRGFGNAIMDGMKRIFGIKSPSTLMRDEIGKNLALGIGVGLEDGMPELQRDAEKELAKLSEKMKATVGLESSIIGTKITAGTSVGKGTQSIVNNNDNGVTQNVTIVNPKGTPSENARQLRKVGEEMAFGY